MTFSKELRLSKYVLNFFTLIIFTILSFTAIVSSTIYVLVYLISCIVPNYGKFINYADVCLVEDFVNSVPQNSIVISLKLKGDLSLIKLKSIFIKNVLNARSKVKRGKSRYPELKQYLTTFFGFRIWKTDSNFLLDNHIVEKTCNQIDLADIHQKYQNKPYKKHGSPWELILIRNVNLNDATESLPISLIIFRVHHVMADAKSLLKLLVECLGNKPLKTAIPQDIQKAQFGELRFVLNFPWKYILESRKLIELLRNSYHHPWKLPQNFGDPDCQMNKTVVAFSPKLSMSNLKLVAKENNVKTSAVVMSIIAGAIRNCCGDKWNKQVTIGYPLPKPNHPEFLTNHVYLSLMRLATDQQCPFKRVQQCNKEFVRVKNEQQCKYVNVGIMLAGLQIYPISGFVDNKFLVTGITNIAGEEEGFSVGDAKCEDYRISVGTLRGVAGVVFTAISYQDGMVVAVIAKESILSKEVANLLANHIDYELQLLLKNLISQSRCN